MNGLRRAALLARSYTVAAWRYAASNLGLWGALGDAKPCIKVNIEGQAALTAKVCVFVHYDARGMLHHHSRRYIDALVAEGFSILFVSNSTVNIKDLEFVSSRCFRILLRENRGYDFAAYRDGILHLGVKPESLSMLVLANDSVYAPMSPLARMFGEMDFATADVWGATDSWQQQYHLQSYLIAFGPAALAHPAFRQFWSQVLNVRSKWAVVRHYEIGMTQAMQKAGLSCAAVFPYHSLIRRAEAILEAEPPSRTSVLGTALRASAERALLAAGKRRASNPVIDLWLLLADAGGPFLKRELLRDDPTRVPELFAWHRIMQDRAPALYREVMDDLKRVMRRAAP